MPSPWIPAKPGGIDAANVMVFCKLKRRAAPPGCGGALNWSRVQRRFDLGAEGIASICQQYRGGQWFEALHPGGKMGSWLNRVFFPTAAVMGMMMLTGCRSDSTSGNERAGVLNPSLRRIVGNEMVNSVVHEAVHLYAGFGKDRERDVVSLQSTCNTLS